MQTQTNLDYDMHVKLFCVKSNSFIEICALAIIQVHSNINLQHKFDNYVLSRDKQTHNGRQEKCDLFGWHTKECQGKSDSACWIYLSSMKHRHKQHRHGTSNNLRK